MSLLRNSMAAALALAVITVGAGSALSRDHRDGSERGRGFEGRSYEQPRYPPRAYEARPYEGRGYEAYRYAPSVPYPNARYGRGQTLPPAYWGYELREPGRYRLRQPPQGYRWLGVGRDAYLTQRSTGMIVDTVREAY